MLGRRRAQAVDREAVVQAVIATIERDGLLAVTAAAVAERLGVADRDVTEAVDLDQVVGEAYRELGVAELAVVRRTILANPSPAEQMRALLTWLTEAPQEGDQLRLEAWALARRNPWIKEAVMDGEAAWHGVVTGVLRRGARSGDFADADAQEIAALVISVADGINTYELLGFRADLDRRRILIRVVQSELGLAWGSELEAALR